MTQLQAAWLRDNAAQRALGILTDAGHQAYFVGGCVRNTLLGAAVGDLDISTSARPDVVMDLARAAGIKAVPTGIDHGTVTLVIDGQGFEVTTFRRDVETDGRRAVVAFADDIQSDAERRDFTVNALYASADGTLLDPLGGLADLNARKLRFIGDPHDRIREDYLRILRFFRFHAWYGDPSNGIDMDGLAACAELADGLEQLSKERVGHEMIKLLSAPDPSPAVASMATCGALLRILPGAGAHLLPVLVHVEEAMSMSPDPIRRLAAIGGMGDVAEALRLSNDDSKRLARLDDAMHHDTSAEETGYRMGASEGLSALALRFALAGREPDLADVDALQGGAKQVFPLTGPDLMPALTGPALGDALRRAETSWIASGFRKDKETLTKEALRG